MTESEMQAFKTMFRNYCRNEINKGHCDADVCDTCPVNAAYEKIFYTEDADEDEDDEG